MRSAPVDIGPDPKDWARSDCSVIRMGSSVIDLSIVGNGLTGPDESRSIFVNIAIVTKPIVIMTRTIGQMVYNTVHVSGSRAFQWVRGC